MWCLNVSIYSKLKKANSLFREKNYIAAKELYNELLSSSDSYIKKQVLFNLELINYNISFNPEVEKGSVGNGLINTYLNSKENDTVFVGIASIPGRAEALKSTIESLYHQVDKIGIYLDGYNSVPDFIKENDKVVYKTSDDFERKVGDAGKFYWVDSHSGFYFTCDDDLIYPKDYVQRIKSKILSNKKPLVVGWHGSVLLSPFENYYDKSSRRVFAFGAPRPYDTPVHILGTGCLGFHTNDIVVSFGDFPTPNMADVYFAKVAQEQKVPFQVIKHDRDEITEFPNTKETSIYAHSSANKSNSSHNTKEIQNRIVKSIDWRLNFVDDVLDILVVGRFKINKKGGVYKSSHLLLEYLSQLGHRVTSCCLSELEELNIEDASYDFALFYAPDPERPDFQNCINFVKKLINKNVTCAVNFSFNLNKERTSWIRQQLDDLNEGFEHPRCFFASFSNSTSLVLGEEYQDRVVPFPKTIKLNHHLISRKSFEEREGIFLGDLAKLGNSRLTHGNVLKWLEQIRIKLPHVNIYVLKHYHTDIKLANYLKVLPYTEEIESILPNFRLCVNLTPGATFEMVPVEAMLSGTPVLHRSMPQSLSEYLSPNAIEVSTPSELGELCKRLYENESLWARTSDAGLSAYNSLKVENVIAAFDMSIRKCLNRAGV